MNDIPSSNRPSSSIPKLVIFFARKRVEFFNSHKIFSNANFVYIRRKNKASFLELKIFFLLLYPYPVSSVVLWRACTSFLYCRKHVNGFDFLTNIRWSYTRTIFFSVKNILSYWHVRYWKNFSYTKCVKVKLTFHRSMFISI